MNAEIEQRLRERLAEAESYLDALQNQEVDAVVGRNEVLLLKLKDFEDQYSSMVENLPDVIFRLDQNLRHVYMSPVVKFYTGKEPEAFLGKTGREAGIFGDQWELFEEACQKLLKDGKPRHIDYQHETPHGTRFLQSRIFSENNDKDARFILGITADVTEQRTAQEALRQNENRLRTIIEGANLGIWEFLPQTDELKHWNPRMEQLYELESSSSHTAATFRSRTHPDDTEALAKSLKEAESAGHLDLTYRIVLPSGDTKWIRLAGQASRESGDKEIRLTGIAEDATDQKLSEQRLARAKAAADHANKSKSDFLANMSHEIRTPMSAILGYADLLGYGADEELAAECISSIKANGSLLVTIINDVLDLSKVEAGKLQLTLQRISPREIIEEAVALMKGAANDKKLSLVTAFEELPERIETDPHRLKQILINLISNAIKFTEHGNVEVTGSCSRETGMMRIAVSDMGDGVSPQFQAKLFRPFEQDRSSARSDHGGTGLGLAICRRLSELLGGAIHLERTGADGSTFSLTIPISDEADQATTTSRLEMSSDDKRLLAGALVLIVDDVRDLRNVFAHSLQHLGCATLLAASGEEALALIDQSDTPPDLVLLDMRLPGMDGFETARSMRHSGFKGPIIAITAHVMQSKREECLAAGCTDFLAKPIEHQVLVRTLLQHLGS